MHGGNQHEFIFLFLSLRLLGDARKGLWVGYSPRRMGKVVVQVA